MQLMNGCDPIERHVTWSVLIKTPRVPRPLFLTYRHHAHAFMNVSAFARFYCAMSRLHDVAVFVTISSLLRHLERSLKEAINTWGRGFTTWELLEQGVNCQHGHTKLCIPTYQHTEEGVDYHTKTYCSAATSEWKWTGSCGWCCLARCSRWWDGGLFETPFFIKLKDINITTYIHIHDVDWLAALRSMTTLQSRPALFSEEKNLY